MVMIGLGDSMVMVTMCPCPLLVLVWAHPSPSPLDAVDAVDTLDAVDVKAELRSKSCPRIRAYRSLPLSSLCEHRNRYCPPFEAV